MLIICATCELCNCFAGYFAQGLDDHSHKPTLERLPKDKLVVGSPAAAAVCQSLGFTNVYGLDHGKTMSVCNGRLQITATAGEHAVIVTIPVRAWASLGQHTCPCLFGVMFKLQHIPQLCYPGGSANHNLQAVLQNLQLRFMGT